MQTTNCIFVNSFINKGSQSYKSVLISTVPRWLNQYNVELHGKAGIGLPITPDQRRIRELELENKRLRGDVDILKKAMTCFIKPSV